MVSSAETWCGGASRRRDPSSIPAGYASQTGYQYDSISRVAGQRELAPPSKFSKLGGLSRTVFITSGILYPQGFRFVPQTLKQKSLALTFSVELARRAYALLFATRGPAGIPVFGTGGAAGNRD